VQHADGRDIQHYYIAWTRITLALLHVPDRDGQAGPELVDRMLMQIVHLNPSVGAAVGSRDVVEVRCQHVPVEVAVAADEARHGGITGGVKGGFSSSRDAVVVGVEHADLLQELPEVDLRLVRGGRAGAALARLGVVDRPHGDRGHRLLQGVEAGHGRSRVHVGDDDDGAGRRGGHRREMIGRGELLVRGRRRNAQRRRRRRLGWRAVILELLQPLVDDAHVVLRVEVEQAVGRDGGGAPGRGREPPEPLVRGGGGYGGGAEVRQVEEGVGAVEPARGLVVGERGLLGGGEGAEPEAGALVGLSDLGHPLAPRPLAHAAVLARRVLRAALPPRRALLPRALAAVALHWMRREGGRVYFERRCKQELASFVETAWRKEWGVYSVVKWETGRRQERRV
jgi:hypothetical protein